MANLLSFHFSFWVLSIVSLFLIRNNLLRIVIGGILIPVLYGIVQFQLGGSTGQGTEFLVRSICFLSSIFFIIYLITKKIYWPIIILLPFTILSAFNETAEKSEIIYENILNRIDPPIDSCKINNNLLIVKHKIRKPDTLRIFKF